MPGARNPAWGGGGFDGGAASVSDILIPRSAAPPASPVDLQFWQCIADATAGVHWLFRYNAASPSANKWEFAGGPPLFSEVTAFESTSSATYVALTTPGPSIALPRAGDYYVEHGSTPDLGAAAATVAMSYDIGATPASDQDAAVVVDNTTNGPAILVARPRLKAGLGAVTLTAKYKTSGGTVFIDRRWMRVTPVRVQ